MFYAAHFGEIRNLSRGTQKSNYWPDSKAGQFGKPLIHGKWAVQSVGYRNGCSFRFCSGWEANFPFYLTLVRSKIQVPSNPANIVTFQGIVQIETAWTILQNIQFCWRNVYRRPVIPPYLWINPFKNSLDIKTRFPAAVLYETPNCIHVHNRVHTKRTPNI